MLVQAGRNRMKIRQVSGITLAPYAYKVVQAHPDASLDWQRCFERTGLKARYFGAVWRMIPNPCHEMLFE
jgi:hypothetical protein